MSDFHQPVMVDEVADFLINRSKNCLVDLTCGGGNHLKHFAGLVDDKSILIGIDRDPDALKETRDRLKGVAQEVYLANCPYSEFDTVLKNHNLRQVDGFFLDLGISSYQIDTAKRGFSFTSDGPLDMRMGPDTELTAESIVNEFSKEQLALIFREYGEEKRAVSVANAIIEKRESERIITTQDLVNTISPVLSPKYRNASLARIFQSLRIYINGEIQQLKSTLPRLLDYLSEGGRIVVLAYHSLEDRVVKQFFKSQSDGCICPPKLPVCACGFEPTLKILTRKVIKPSAEEIARNVRARSARLRAAEKTA